MIYNYKECIEKYKNHHALSFAMKKKEIFKIKKGIYSTLKKPKLLEIFIKEHKGAIFTMESAFYYLGISDVVPNVYNIATDKDSSKYKDKNIKQYFMNNGLISVGGTTISYLGVKIKIYNKERMLIEAIRYKNKMPFDYYKEIINYYRNHIDEINIPLLLEYLESFPKKKLILNILQAEVL